MTPEPHPPLALTAPQREPTPGDMLMAVLDRGVTNLDVAAVEKLTALYERMEDRKAEKQFAAAFVALQADMPKIQATKAVPNNDGTVRYKFAPFEDLMRQVGPLLQKHGFTVSFANRYDDKRLVEICTLQHVAGHKRANEFAVRIGSGPPRATETQADGAAATYAKRFALCDALNIVVAHLDDDARNEGSPISEQEAAALRQRVLACGADEVAFLKFAGVTDLAGEAVAPYRKIASERMATLDDMLSRKERKAKS